MSPHIAGMLKASATLIEAAEAGDKRVSPQYCASARVYATALIAKYRGHARLQAVVDASPALQRLQASLERQQALLH